MGYKFDPFFFGKPGGVLRNLRVQRDELGEKGRATRSAITASPAFVKARTNVARISAALQFVPRLLVTPEETPLFGMECKRTPVPGRFKRASYPELLAHLPGGCGPYQGKRGGEGRGGGGGRLGKGGPGWESREPNPLLIRRSEA